jgi:hypothetical protein
MAACYYYDSDAKIGWEPELAIPLVFFEVDLNQDVKPESLSMVAFRFISTQSKQNDLMFRLVSTMLDDTVKNRLPAYLRTDVDTFMACYSRGDLIPDHASASLLASLLEAFKKNHSITALDHFAYAILTANELSQVYRDSMATMVYAMRFPSDVISTSMTMDFLSERSDQLFYLKVQITLSSRLQMVGNITAVLLDSTRTPLDTIVNAQQAHLPFPPEGERIMVEYASQDMAQKIIRAKYALVQLDSDTSGICMGVDQIRDLYNRKINVAIGIMAKLNIDDVAEK